MIFDFHPEADEEFVAAVAYYEDSDPGLGIDFSREIYFPHPDMCGRSPEDEAPKRFLSCFSKICSCGV